MKQRDVFWNTVCHWMEEDRDVVIVSADMGAPALDQVRSNLPSQYIDAGIAEQAAMSVSAGLALSGKTPFVYAIAPFISLRCLEQIRVDVCAMNLPVIIVGVGAGFSYDDSGPTHHTTEDISALRPMPNLEIINVSDNVMARQVVDCCYTSDHPIYVRLDRKLECEFSHDNINFPLGFRAFNLTNNVNQKVVMVATGNMVEIALEMGMPVIDVFSSRFDVQALLSVLENYEDVVTLEEHAVEGGFGSMVCDAMIDEWNVMPKVHRLGIHYREGFCYQYGNREELQRCFGIDAKNVYSFVEPLKMLSRVQNG